MGNPTRRDVLKAAGLVAVGGGVALGSMPVRPGDHAVILLLMVGGPSSIETFDPKPDAPSEVRGPFRSIATSLPGVRISEHLPRVARRMDRLTLIRSIHHDAAPIHETGLQLIQTGRLSEGRVNFPHFGSIGEAPPVILGGSIGNTGVATSNGQPAGELARRLPSFSGEPRNLIDSYGPSDFGRDCLMARRLVEAGSRVVVVNMARTVFGRSSWDAHGRDPFSTFDDYADRLLPAFDRGFSALIDDLRARGMLDSTLVVATGEIGRASKINQWGGRDHSTAAWSALMAGGGAMAGEVVGATDERGSEVVDRPVHASFLHQSMVQALGPESIS